MNIGAVVVLFKLLRDAGLTEPAARPPSDPGRPAKPYCGPGREAYWNEAQRKYQCVLEFD